MTILRRRQQQHQPASTTDAHARTPFRRQAAAKVGNQSVLSSLVCQQCTGDAASTTGRLTTTTCATARNHTNTHTHFASLFGFYDFRGEGRRGDGRETERETTIVCANGRATR